MKIALLLLTIVSSVWCAAAQDASDSYADIPQSRAADGGFILGDPNAGFKLIEFSDFLCPHCQAYEAEILRFIDGFVRAGNAAYEYRFFPVIDPQGSTFSAALVECADALAPGSFWLARDVMFELVADGGFKSQTAAEFSTATGLDAAQLETCAAGASQFQIDLAYGESLGVRGTPATFAQFGDSAPIAIAPPSGEHFAALANALRPASITPVSIADGNYAGLETFRREDGGFVLGSPDAPMTVVAFEDFLCPHCQTYVETVHSFIDAHVRSGAAQFEYRFYPVVDRQRSPRAARIAECAGHQDGGKFWDAHDLLFDLASNPAAEIDWASVIVAELELDDVVFQDCLSRSVQFLVDVALAQKTGVRGTPSIRARLQNGPVDLIYYNDQPIDRGAPPLAVLDALAQGDPSVTVGYQPPSLLNSRFFDDVSLVTGEPCDPPCWQNIAPGETSVSDAVDILESLGADPLQAGIEGILFGTNGVPCCQINSDDGETVSAILLQLAPKMLLGDVIARLGEPTFVTGLPFSETEHALVLIYPESGFFAYAFVAGADGQLEAISPIVTVMFTTPDDLKAAISNLPLDGWQGFQSYADYMDGEFDHLPGERD